MFITEEEALRRLRTEENLINRVQRGDSSSPPLEEVVPPSLPLDSDILNISEAPREIDREVGKKESRAKARKGPIDFELASAVEAEAALDKLLNGDKGYAGRGTKGLHRDEQAGIGVTASILGPTRASKLGDVAISSSYSYERGYTGPVDAVDPNKSPKEELREKIIEGHGIVVDKCFGRLLKTLDLLDDTKLGEVKRATDLSVIAKNLSGIVSHATQATQDKVVENNEKNVHFHIMRPDRAEESDYKTIEISSETSELQWQEHNRES